MWLVGKIYLHYLELIHKYGKMSGNIQKYNKGSQMPPQTERGVTHSGSRIIDVGQPQTWYAHR